MTPDIAGFQDAMRRLRTATGRDVTFHIPVAPQWPAGTQLDPETGEPYDPTVKPTTGGGFTDVVKHVGVVYKDESRLRPGADTQETAIGPRSGMDEILDLDILDYLDVQDATEVSDLDARYRIVERKQTGMTEAERVLVYMERL